MSGQIADAGAQAFQALDQVTAQLGDKGQAVSGQIADAGAQALQALDQVAAQLGDRGQAVSS